MRSQFDRADLMLFNYDIEDLKKLRKKCGLSQREIGRFFGIHYTTVLQWEKGKINNPMVLQMYGIFLERYYARLNNYIPAFRKIGGDTFISEEELRSGYRREQKEFSGFNYSPEGCREEDGG